MLKTYLNLIDTFYFLGTTALFLSASCFISPYKYLSEEETRQMVYNYIAYLRDHTKLIANPGLKVCKLLIFLMSCPEECIFLCPFFFFRSANVLYPRMINFIV